jgi:hypothetical protein
VPLHDIFVREDPSCATVLTAFLNGALPVGPIFKSSGNVIRHFDFDLHCFLPTSSYPFGPFQVLAGGPVISIRQPWLSPGKRKS